MKKKYPNHEAVCHAYSKDPFDPEGGECGSLHFRNGVLYSYTLNCVIARARRSKSKVVVITSSPLSNSSSKHRTHAYSALSHYKWIRVPRPDTDVSHNWEVIKEEIKGLAGKILKARKNKQQYADLVLEMIGDLEEFAKFLDVKPSPEIRREIRKYRKDFSDFDTSPYRKKLEAGVKKEKAAKSKKEAEEIKKFLAFKSDTVSMIDKVFLRYNKRKDIVETSKRYEADPRGVKLLYSLWKRGEARGTFFDGYLVRRSDAEGIEVGCHRVEKGEIKRFATEMKW